MGSRSMGTVSNYAEDEWESISDVARTFRYFVMESKYGYVDRLANAFNTKIAETAIQEAIREARSAADSGEKVHIPSENSLKKLFQLIERDLATAKILAAISLAYGERRKTEGEE